MFWSEDHVELAVNLCLATIAGGEFRASGVRREGR
jgi:hypothetical protein